MPIRLGPLSLSLRARPGRTHGAGRNFFSRRPLQKLAVPKRLHEESSPALRLNSALTGVRQRRKNARENFPHAGTKKQHNFFTGLREKKSLPAPCVLPGRARRLKESGPSRMGNAGRALRNAGDAGKRKDYGLAKIAWLDYNDNIYYYTSKECPWQKNAACLKTNPFMKFYSS